MEASAKAAVSLQPEERELAEKAMGAAAAARGRATALAEKYHLANMMDADQLTEPTQMDSPSGEEQAGPGAASSSGLDRETK